jgi:hypothetical protein
MYTEKLPRSTGSEARWGRIHRHRHLHFQWTYATGLTGPAGLSTSAGGHPLVFNAAADTGLTAAPIFNTWVNGFNWSGFTNPDLTIRGDPDGDGIVSSSVPCWFRTDHAGVTAHHLP